MSLFECSTAVDTLTKMKIFNLIRIIYEKIEGQFSSRSPFSPGVVSFISEIVSCLQPHHCQAPLFRVFGIFCFVL